ncbi:MAG: DegT/DnrJ/EryC1/StrS family aminotransferase [Planctomycetota bacterium]
MSTKVKIQIAPHAAALQWPVVAESAKRRIADMLDRGEISLSPIVGELEQAFVRYLGQGGFALGMSNGTAALHAAMTALGIGPGDEVIAPTYTYWASASPAALLGARVVFADSDRETFNITPAIVEPLIGPRTKAIVAVHLNGNPCDMKGFAALGKKRGVAIIEDCSHAHGAAVDGRKVGTFGAFGCFSLQGSKVMPAGEGGLLFSADRGLLDRATVVGHYERCGELATEALRRYQGTGGGYKYRMSPLHAAIALGALENLDAWNAISTRNCERLGAAIGSLPGIHLQKVLPGHRRVFYQNTLRFDERAAGFSKDALCERLQGMGAQVRQERYKPLHQKAFFTEHGVKADQLPGTVALIDSIVQLPNFPWAETELIDQYAAAFHQAYDELAK